MKLNLHKTFNYLFFTLLSLMLISILSVWVFLPYQGIADNRVKVYSNKAINLVKVTALLNASPIKSDQTVHFFLVPRWVMILSNPLIGFKSQGFNIAFINFVFANEDSNIDTARTFEGLIAHETTHTDIIDKFGYRTLFYPHWKIEGVCDFVSQESSIYPKDVPVVLEKYHQNKQLNQKELYLIYKMKVQTLINQGKSISDIITSDIKDPKI